MAERIFGIDFGTYAVKIYKIRQGICFHQKRRIAMIPTCSVYV